MFKFTDKGFAMLHSGATIDDGGMSKRSNDDNEKYALFLFFISLIIFCYFYSFIFLLLSYHLIM